MNSKQKKINDVFLKEILASDKFNDRGQLICDYKTFLDCVSMMQNIEITDKLNKAPQEPIEKLLTE